MHWKPIPFPYLVHPKWTLYYITEPEMYKEEALNHPCYLRLEDLENDHLSTIKEYPI